MSQEKLQTMVMQKFFFFFFFFGGGEGNRGVLWDCASSQFNKAIYYISEIVYLL